MIEAQRGHDRCVVSGTKRDSGGDRKFIGVEVEGKKDEEPKRTFFRGLRGGEKLQEASYNKQEKGIEQSGKAGCKAGEEEVLHKKGTKATEYGNEARSARCVVTRPNDGAIKLEFWVTEESLGIIAKVWKNCRRKALRKHWFEGLRMKRSIRLKRRLEKRFDLKDAEILTRKSPKENGLRQILRPEHQDSDGMEGSSGVWRCKFWDMRRLRRLCKAREQLGAERKVERCGDVAQTFLLKCRPNVETTSKKGLVNSSTNI
ncbi:hypothetical protein B0H16DRAFT_1691044 [Mycena metata]|uniref:Uncharacterized protein n=1 Tax=Mycena metata TaxID=1033252 RepID=A0AAD7IXW3_9AGAR|nr:hypothetical protein B0H16DRAFT_1691044 [Mycena metata]